MRALNFDGHNLWAATAGGVLRVQNGAITKWTRPALPSNETFDSEREGDRLWVRFPLSRASFDGENWEVQDAPAWKRRAPSAQWNGQKVTADWDGLHIGVQTIGLPAQSGGTHISAL